jgi:hypothetical protein
MTGEVTLFQGIAEASHCPRGGRKRMLRNRDFRAKRLFVGFAASFPMAAVRSCKK